MVDAYARSSALVFLNYGADATLSEIATGLQKKAAEFLQAAEDEQNANSRAALENFERARRELDVLEAEAAHDKAFDSVITRLRQQQQGGF